MVPWLLTSAMASFLNMGEKVRRNSVSKTEFRLCTSRTDITTPTMYNLDRQTTHHTTMSWACRARAGNTRSTTRAAEEEAAATGTQLGNVSLPDILMLMGRMTVDVDPTPTAAEWPDEEHITLARHAIEHPFLVVPHPKNAGHSLCVVCGIFAAITLVVPDSGTVPEEWPACKGMFPLTHCRSCAMDEAKNKYVYIAAPCGCGVLLSGNRGTICNACYNGENMLKDCNGEGCGRKRHGSEPYCKSCCNLNKRRTSTCFLCEGEITRHGSNLTSAKKRINYVPKKIIWIATVYAKHTSTRAESAEMIFGAKAKNT
jgi:hypothetical protein